MSEERRSVGTLGTLAAGAVIGGVEVVLAISFAALVFGGYLSTSPLVREDARGRLTDRTRAPVTLLD